jgi:uncharacterized membrane-anchored protein YhcB (DUF1043 family)
MKESDSERKVPPVKAIPVTDRSGDAAPRKINPHDLAAVIQPGAVKFTPEPDASAADHRRQRTLWRRLWHHRLRAPLLYTLLGVTLTAAANVFEAYRIYLMQGDLILPVQPVDRGETRQDAEGDALVRLRTGFNRENYRIENDMKVRERNWPFAYLAKLQALQDAFRDQGDFMAWMDVKRERERFERQQSLLESHLVKTPEPLRKLQLEYHNVVERYEADMREALARNYNQYMLDLDELRAAKTRAAAAAETLRAIDVEIDFMRRYKSLAPAASAPEADPSAVKESAVAEEKGDEEPAADPNPAVGEPPVTE